MRRGFFGRPWVVNFGVFWTVRASAGLYELQEHDGSTSTWDYKYRIVEKRDMLPSRIVATANAAEEIALDWQYFTSQSWVA
jgi:hypothetical protein